MELLGSIELTEFIPNLRRFIARRSRPNIIYSDNSKTFKAADSWLREVRTDEKFNAFQADKQIEWRFDLSRTPYWGG